MCPPPLLIIVVVEIVELLFFSEELLVCLYLSLRVYLCTFVIFVFFLGGSLLKISSADGILGGMAYYYD